LAGGPGRKEILKGIDSGHGFDLILLDDTRLSADNTFEEALEVRDNWRGEAISLHDFSRLS
jgi:hypothetical protein